MRADAKAWAKVQAEHATYYENEAAGNPSQCKRFNAVLEFMQSPILDVGCRDGAQTNYLARCDMSVMGIDLPKVIEKWRHLYRFPTASCDAHALPFHDGSFNTVYAGELLEHLLYPDIFIEEARRVLKNEGRLIISTPDGEEASKVHKDHCNWTDAEKLERELAKHKYTPVHMERIEKDKTLVCVARKK